MSGFSVAISSFLVLLPTIFAFSQNDLGQKNVIAERDNWWEFKDTYTDKPRYFGAIKDCPVPSFYLDCNLCTCNQATERVPSEPECTRMMCSRVPQIYNFGENGQGCPANRTFYHKCNQCNCYADGEIATCTRMACNVPEKEPHEKENWISMLPEPVKPVVYKAHDVISKGSSKLSSAFNSWF